MKCKNHRQCKGTADGKDGLCSCCREARKEEKVDEKYRLDTTNFRSSRRWLDRLADK
jgi:hypothetical protein